MSYFTVTRTAGPAWTEGGITEQPGINDHASFMNTLADEASSSSPDPSLEPNKAASAHC